MFMYDIHNPNGSLVFVRGVRVKPYATFSANLEPTTARELARYGVNLRQVGVEVPALTATSHNSGKAESTTIDKVVESSAAAPAEVEVEVAVAEKPGQETEPESVDETGDSLEEDASRALDESVQHEVFSEASTESSLSEDSDAPTEAATEDVVEAPAETKSGRRRKKTKRQS